MRGAKRQEEIGSPIRLPARPGASLSLSQQRAK